jgi:hypothetical protein
MVVASRVLAICCVVLLVTGAAGAAGAVGTASKGSHRPATSVSIPTTPTMPTSAPAASPPTGSAALVAGLVQPTDMGGYYRSSPSSLAGLLDANPCLAALQPSPAQAGRAAEGLTTGDLYSVPQIIEVVESYSGNQPAAVYDSTMAAIGACTTFGFDFDGSAVSGRLAGDHTLTTSAQEAKAWSVPFSYGGTAFDLQMALVLQGQDVFFVAWADTAVPSNAIMGSFGSTVTLAIGEEA